MSKLRITSPAARGSKSPDYADSLYMIRDSVRRRRELIKGKLEDAQGGVCAIGAFFNDNPNLSLKADLIDEVAAYNDSVQTCSPRQRKRKVLEWLNWKLRVLSGGVTKGLRVISGGKRAA